jgi:hypothetical protein
MQCARVHLEFDLAQRIVRRTYLSHYSHKSHASILQQHQIVAVHDFAAVVVAERLLYPL